MFGGFTDRAQAAGKNFVKTNGSQLLLRGTPWVWRLVYGTLNPGGQGTIAGTVSLALQAGLNTVRLVNFIDEWAVGRCASNTTPNLGEDPREQAEARPGVAAVEVGRRLAEPVDARRRDDRSRGRLPVASSMHPPDVRAQRGADRRGRADVRAVAGALDPALAGGERREHQRPMADRLVAGQRQARRGAAPRGGRRADWAEVAPVIGPPSASRARRRTRRSPARSRRGSASRWRPRTCSWTGTSSAIISRNWSRVSCCSASESAASGVGMDLDHHAVGPDRDGADRQRLDEPALPGGVARVDDDRQVGQVAEQRHGRQVQRVPGVRLERPDARARRGSRSGCRS